MSEILSSLIEGCSGDPKIEDIEGQTPIHFAVDFNREHLVQWFLEKYGVLHCIEGMIAAKENPE